MRAGKAFISRLFDPGITIEEDRLAYLVRKFEIRNYYLIVTSIIAVTTIKFIMNPATYWRSYLVTWIIWSNVIILLYKKKTHILNGFFSALHFFSSFLFPFLNPKDIIGGPYTIMLYAFVGLCASKSTKLFIIQILFNVGVYFFIMEYYIMVKLEQMSKEEILEQVSSGYYGFLRISAFLVPVIVLYHNFFFHTMQDTVRLSKDLAETNTELSIKKKELEQEIKTKAAFLITFSHELKNAINGLNGNLTLAMDVNKNQEVDSYLSTAKVCGTMIRHFMQNILDMDKIDADNLHISPSQTDSQEFFKSLWEVSSELIRNKRLRGSINFLTQIPSNLVIDSDKIFQVIVNLVSNAVKFTEHGQICLQVKWTEKNEMATEDLTPRTERTEREDSIHLLTMPASLIRHSIHRQDAYFKKFLSNTINTSAVHPGLFVEYSADISGELEFSVSDTGCGMSEQQIQTVFTKFSQIDQHGQNVRRTGCGIGLWVSKSIARGMNGDIMVTSQKDSGTSVVFHIGASTFASKSAPEASGSTKVQELGSPELFGKAKKLLIADDDSFNTELLRRFACKLNLGCLWVSNGRDLVLKYQECYREVGMIITDNSMPEMEGVEAALQISEFMARKRIRKIPVFLLTADASILVKRNTELIGITKMISKPIDFMKFSALIKEYSFNLNLI